LQTSWNPDDLTTVTANVGRTVHETVFKARRE